MGQAASQGKEEVTVPDNVAEQVRGIIAHGGMPVGTCLYNKKDGVLWNIGLSGVQSVAKDVCLKAEKPPARLAATDVLVEESKIQPIVQLLADKKGVPWCGSRPFGGKEYWGNVLRRKYHMAIVGYTSDAKKPSDIGGFVLLQRKPMYTDKSRTVWYIDLICSHVGFGSKLLTVVKNETSALRQPVVALSALPQVISYYAKYGFELPPYSGTPDKRQALIAAGTRISKLERKRDKFQAAARSVGSVRAARRTTDPARIKMDAARVKIVEMYTEEVAKAKVELAKQESLFEALLLEMGALSNYSLLHGGEEAPLGEIYDEGVYMVFGDNNGKPKKKKKEATEEKKEEEGGRVKRGRARAQTQSRIRSQKRSKRTRAR